MSGWNPWPLAEAGEAAWQGRANIREMTQAAERAVIAPAEPGAFPHDWRRAVAARIAAMNGQGALARHYGDGLPDDHAALAAPDGPGRDAREVAVLRFMDRVAAHPREVEAEEVAALRAVGVGEADIVRLCELNAFLGYQARVVAGLALMVGEGGA